MVASVIARLASAAPKALSDRVLVDRAPESLHTFVRLAWGQVEPARPFVDGRVLHLVCEHLEAVSKGEIKRLLINIPPGFTKSLLTGVFWPVWDWIRRSERRYIYASYDPGLTLRDARKAHDLLVSRWFVERWGMLLPYTRQPYGDYFTKQRGNRFSTSIKGRATGRHFDVHVADDPTKPKDAYGGAMLSEAALEEAIRFWDQTMTTRASDIENVARIIVMQRLHQRDLSGHVLDRDKYVHLCIPMRYEAKRRCKASCGCVLKDWRTEDGQLAWPERFPENAVNILETELGSRAAVASQLQQSPTPKGGLIFKEKDFRYWHPAGPSVLDPNGLPCVEPLPPRDGTYIQSWDMTFKDSDGTDFVAGGVFQVKGTSMYLVDLINRRMAFTEACDAVRGMTTRWPGTMRKLVEDKANGPAVENSLRKSVGGLWLVNPKGGKIARANASTVFFELGNIFFPHPSIAPWVVDLIDQLINFPFASHDDMVDMVTQAINDHFERVNSYADAMGKVDKELRQLMYGNT